MERISELGNKASNFKVMVNEAFALSYLTGCSG